MEYDLSQSSLDVVGHFLDAAKLSCRGNKSFQAKEFAFDGGALNWFDLPKASFRCLKPLLAKLQTVFVRHGELRSRRRRGRSTVFIEIGGVCQSMSNNHGE